ncbi:hypothetical protein D3C81_1283760 [compost metagenome]
MLAHYERVKDIYSYRRLTIHLRRQTGQQIIHKRIQRLRCLMTHSYRRVLAVPEFFFRFIDF